MELPQAIINVLANMGAAGVMAMAVVYIYRQYTSHLETEIVYLRSKNEEHEKRLMSLEGPNSK